MHEEARRRRQPAMAPDDRRAALVAATIPLLYERGLDVSTKQIAGAAGVAEGTIFGVFKDKNSLLVAALVEALDVHPLLDRLTAIDPALNLRERLTVAADLIQRQFAENARLMGAARTLSMATENHEEAAARMLRSHQLLEATLTAVIEPDAAALRRSPGATARLLLLFAGANTYGPYADPENFDGAELASLLLDGLLATELASGLVIIENGDE